MRDLTTVVMTLVLVSHVASGQPETQRPHLIVHRQAPLAAPENTWAALKQAVLWGADSTITLEVDLAVTKDGKIFLFHDDWFDWKNDEVQGSASDFLWEEINDVDFGSWFDPRFNGEYLPLFEDVVKFCKENGVRVVLDHLNPSPAKPDRASSEMVLQVLDKHDARGVVYFQMGGSIPIGRETGPATWMATFDGDREQLRRALKQKEWGTIWVDDPRVLLDVLRREVPKRAVKMPEFSRDYRVEDLDFHALVKQVRSGGDEGRVAAARLRKHFKKRAGMAFVAILREPETSSHVRATVARALGRLREGEKEGEGRKGNGEISKEAGAALHPMLADPNAELRAVAAYALGKLKDEAVVVRLTEMLRNRQEPDKVRVEAVRALGRIGSARTVPSLIEVARAEREKATNVVFPNWAKLWKEKGYSTVPWVLLNCCWALGEIGGEEALEFLLAQHRQVTFPAEKDRSLFLTEAVVVRQHALTAAARIGGAKALEAVKAATWEPPLETYFDYVRLTRCFEPKAAVPVLLEFLGHPKTYQRCQAFYALLRIGKPAVEPLIGLLKNQQANPLAREWAAWTLGWMNDSRAVAPLTDALNDSVPGVRANAAWAMGRLALEHGEGMRVKRSMNRLKELTNDTDPTVRDYAAEALQRLGGGAAADERGVIEVRRTDHGEFRLNRSTRDTPLQIGKQKYQRGLGTHSYSEIVVQLPAPGRRFQARVGVDNNWDTQGKYGSLIFVVEVGGKAVFRSSLLRGGQEPVEVSVDLGEQKQFLLKVMDGGDGQSHDHADWADALVTLADGQRLPLDKMRTILKLPDSAGAMFEEDPQPRPRPAPGRLVKSWTLATDDTRLKLGVTADDLLCISELGCPAAGWNWTADGSVFPLMTTVSVAAKEQTLKWRYVDAALEKSEGEKLTLRFVTGDDPALELKSEWWARPGPGPIRHAMSIANKAGRPIAITCQPSIDLALAAPASPKDALHGWYVKDEGTASARDGLQREVISPGYGKSVVATPGNDYIPFMMLDAGGGHGLYVGIEWSLCRIKVSAREASAGLGVWIEAGNASSFYAEIADGYEFQVPPAFVGAYQGDADDAGNRLRKYLFRYGMPEVLRTDPTHPKLEWNAFSATGKAPESWDPVEVKYYPLVKEAAALGFDDLAVDVDWWKGPEPDADPEDWARGMKAAGDTTHKLGMRYVLYWTDGANLAVPKDREVRATRVKRLLDEYGADVWRSDSTRGAVITNNYWAVKGFYDMLDGLKQEMPRFQWENCSGGGPIKDYGAMKRAIRIQLTDEHTTLATRVTFYDSSYALHPMQLMTIVGYARCRTRPGEPGGLVYDFRSMALGAMQWYLDSPTPTNDGKPWTDQERKAIAREVQTYKTRLRPLIRQADLYHILPRPDNRNWDGIQYYDPATGKGVVFVFKPDSGEDKKKLKLRGLDPQARYKVTFEDKSNPDAVMSGAALREDGLEMTLKGKFVSELVFFQKE